MTNSKSTRKKVLLTICALILSIAMTFGIAYASVPSLPTITSTMDQPDFPLDLSPIVDGSTIRFLLPTSIEDTSNELPPIASSTELLPSSNIFDQLDSLDVDTDTLEVGLQIKLKDEFTSSYPCTVLIYNEYGQDFSYTITNNEVVEIDRLIYDLPYQIFVTIEDDNKFIEYIGQFFYGVDVGNVVFISLDFRKIETFKNQTNTNTTAIQESESNNTLATADTGSWGLTINGTISSSSDVDYFKLVNPDDMYRKIDFISRNKSSNATLRFEVYYSNTNSDNLVTTWSVEPNSSYHRVSYIPNYLSGNYYIKVTDKNGTASNSSYLINANLASPYVWYSQLDGYIGGIHYWNTEKLDQLRITSEINVGGYIKSNILFTDHNRSVNTNPDDVMRKACGIVSTAMLIRNRGLYITNITDYRYGTSGNTYADPFTVFLASQGLTGSEINTSTNTLSRSGLTAGISFPNVSSRLYTKSLAWNGTSTVSGWNDTRKETELKNAVQNHIGGVVIYIKNHFMIVTGYDSSATSVNDKFIVYDPFSVNPSVSAGVPFSRTPTCTQNGNVSITQYESMYFIQE